MEPLHALNANVSENAQLKELPLEEYLIYASMEAYVDSDLEGRASRCCAMRWIVVLVHPMSGGRGEIRG